MNSALENYSFMTLGKSPMDLSQPHFCHLKIEAHDSLQRISVSIQLNNRCQGI